MQDTVSAAKQIRRLTLQCIHSQGSGHIGGCLSVADVLAVLYEKFMRIDPANPRKDGRDRLVLSKGHAGPALYATLCYKGYFSEEKLSTLNKLGTTLPSHCNLSLTTGVDMTAGSLGQGMSCACGLAVGSKIKGDGARIYVICGDGELQEGQNWEAAMYAGAKKLDNLVVFVDNNKMQIDGNTADILDVEDIGAKFRAFGFYVQRVDGHDHVQIENAVNNIQKGVANCIVLDTVKGKGVSFYESMGAAVHSTTCNDQQYAAALAELM
ncbi:MAG: transketolase [Corallococcus sp.]|nr:transketolase [Corallococcus sp.]